MSIHTIAQYVGYAVITGVIALILWEVGKVLWLTVRDTHTVWQNARDAGTKRRECWRLPAAFFLILGDQYRARRVGYHTRIIRNRNP